MSEIDADKLEFVKMLEQTEAEIRDFAGDQSLKPDWSRAETRIAEDHSTDGYKLYIVVQVA